MTRRELRERSFELLFRADFYEEESLKEQEEMFLSELAEEKESDRTYLRSKNRGILTHLSEIDALINEKTEGWKTSRMGKVELTLLRLAVYEILYEEDIPVGVSINEAVELAKKYGADSAPSFVNGILAKFA